MSEILTNEEIQRISVISELKDMKNETIQLIDRTRTAEKKKVYLRRQIQNSKNTLTIMQILYNMLLSGEKMNIHNSRYSNLMSKV